MSFLYELHLHTDETSPCGMVKAKKVVEIYHQLGYHGIAVTDHFNTPFFEKKGKATWEERVESFYLGYRLAKEEGDRIGLIVIPAMEFTFSGTNDDILIYGAEPEWVMKQKEFHRLGPAGLARVARENNLLCIQAHPFRHYITRVYDELIEGLEVVNGNPRHMSSNDRAIQLAKERDWLAIAGSDFHQVQDAGRCGVWLPESVETTTALAQVLRKTHPLSFHIGY